MDDYKRTAKEWGRKARKVESRTHKKNVRRCAIAHLVEEYYPDVFICSECGAVFTRLRKPK